MGLCTAIEAINERWKRKDAPPSSLHEVILQLADQIESKAKTAEDVPPADRNAVQMELLNRHLRRLGLLTF